MVAIVYNRRHTRMTNRMEAARLIAMLDSTIAASCLVVSGPVRAASAGDSNLRAK